jgi:hypothetical protein
VEMVASRLRPYTCKLVTEEDEGDENMVQWINKSP